MKTDQETISSKLRGDVFTGIHTVEALSPDVRKTLNVEDVEMVIIIDKKWRKHFRVNFPNPTKIRTGDLNNLRQDNRVEGTWEKDTDGSECWWFIQRYAEGEDKTGLFKECLAMEGCPRLGEVIDLGPD